MTNPLIAFLLHLAEHPEDAKKFGRSQASAREMMKNAHLSERDQELLLHGKAREIDETLARAAAEDLARTADVEQPAPTVMMLKMSVCFTQPPPTD